MEFELQHQSLSFPNLLSRPTRATLIFPPIPGFDLNQLVQASPAHRAAGDEQTLGRGFREASTRHLVSNLKTPLEASAPTHGCIEVVNGLRTAPLPELLQHQISLNPEQQGLAGKGVARRRSPLQHLRLHQSLLAER